MRKKYPGIINVVLIALLAIALLVAPAVALAMDQQLVTLDHGVQALTMVPPAVTTDGSGSALVDPSTGVTTTWSFAQIQSTYGSRQLTTHPIAITGFTLATRASPLSAATRGVMDQTTYGYGKRSVGISPHPVLDSRTTTQHRIVHGMTLGVT